MQPCKDKQISIFNLNEKEVIATLILPIER